jgi:DNA-binding NtrC family response regulator
MRVLLDYAWPGNVRELEHTIERAVLLTAGPDRHGGGPEPGAGRPPRLAASGGDTSLEAMELDEAERYLIRRALERHDGNVSQAANSLGLSRSALYRRLQRYGL